MIRKLLYIIFGLFTSLVLNAQSFEEYKKQRENDLQKVYLDLNTYYSNKDKEFQEFLKQQWVSFKVFKGIESSDNPKLTEIPNYVNKGNLSYRQIQAIKPKVNSLGQINLNLPKHLELFLRDTNVNRDFQSEAHTIDFYGVKLSFLNEEFSLPQPPSNFNSEGFSIWWKEASKANYLTILDQLTNYRVELNLNDWAYYQLLKKIAEYNNMSPINQKLFVWFLLNRSGYDVRLAHTENKLSLLIPVKQRLYHMTYVEIADNIYYLVDNWNSSRIKTYERGYASATKKMDLNLYQPMKIGNSVGSKDFVIYQLLDTVTFTANYNSDWISFFRSYPQGDLEIYFNAVVSSSAKYSIIESISTTISNMSELDAINFLLRHVQYGFDYKRDIDQFGHEKYLFPEETLYYQYSDCEDRAIYFAWLVRELLGLDVVGLKYKGHIASAVAAINEDGIQGDYILIRNKKYFIADPTYLGSPIGVTMPDFANEFPEIIEIY